MVSQGGRGGEGVGHMVLKKGPWTAAEDAMLLEYVKRQGEGNWNAVQKNSGLQRCGKSCRLRWANHLRPFLKKGPFTPDEEKTIIDLHSKIGNKWARMAAQLPGRTDNEIKNYWNTRLKRRQRAGLPVYPMDLLQQHYNHIQRQQPPNFSVSPSSSSFASIISAAAASSPISHQNHHRRQNQNSINFMKNCTPSLDLLNYPSYCNNMNGTNASIPFLQGGLTNYNHGFLPRNSPLFNQSFSGKSLSFDVNLGRPDPFSATTSNTTTSFDPMRLSGMGTDNNELSSIQNTIQTSNNSGYMERDDVMGGASSGGGDEVYDKISRGTSGLLSDLLQESQAIKRCEDSEDKDVNGEEDGCNKDAFQDSKSCDNIGLLSYPEHEAHNGVSMSSDHSDDIGMKYEKADVAEEMNVMDDDLLRLLDCPSPVVCIPDWYDVGSTSTNSSREPSNVTTSTYLSSIKRDGDDDWDENNCCWNNMPRVLNS